MSGLRINPGLVMMQHKSNMISQMLGGGSGISALSGIMGGTARMQALPTEAEKAVEQQERVREKFASGDGVSTMRELSPEEAAQRREEARNKPTTLSVGADEITSNRFSETRDNVTYDVEGVRFSNSEMSALKEIAKSAASMLPTMGSDLDYNAYASMGLAVNMARTYAQEHLNEEQGAVAVKGMESYVERLTNARHAERNEQVDGVYYGVRRTITAAAADSLRKQIAALPGNHSTLLKNISAAQETGGLAAAATNKELSDSIRKDFASVDLRDKAAVKSLLAGYRSKVTPAYREWGLDNKGHDMSLSSKLTNDTSLFSDQIAGILSALDKANGIAVNYYA